MLDICSRGAGQRAGDWEWGAVRGAVDAQGGEFGGCERGGDVQREGVVAVAHAGGGEVIARVAGEHGADDVSTQQNIQPHGQVWVGAIHRPAGDAGGGECVDIALQAAGREVGGGAADDRVQGGFQCWAGERAGGAELQGFRGLVIWVERPE